MIVPFFTFFVCKLSNISIFMTLVIIPAALLLENEWQIYQFATHSSFIFEENTEGSWCKK
jgi:hypothetical protein